MLISSCKLQCKEFSAHSKLHILTTKMDGVDKHAGVLPHFWRLTYLFLFIFFNCFLYLRFKKTEIVLKECQEENQQEKKGRY